MNFIYIVVTSILLAYSNASAFYSTSYYERYNKFVKELSTTPYVKHIDFFIKDGKLRADGHTYTLVRTKELNPNLETLKEYDLQTVVIKIGSNYYKAKPSFKELLFVKRGKKGIFRYVIERKLILVYVPYLDRVKVIGTISQGQFIRENEYREYDINVNEGVKRQILLRILDLLGCKPDRCSMRCDNYGNNYFYRKGKLIGKLENFGSEKLLIEEVGSSEKHVARVILGKNQILMEDINGKVLYTSDYSKNLPINLESLNYKLLLRITN